jgi:Xaa-Pro dipeptidase
VFYATGFQSYFLMQWWRMQGTVLAVIPADESAEVGMMVGDFEAKPARRVSGIRDVRAYMLWPEIRDAEAVQDPLGSGESETPRPAQFDEDEQDGILPAVGAVVGIGVDGIERLHKLPHGLRVAP